LKPLLAALAVLVLFAADGCSSPRRASTAELPPPPPAPPLEVTSAPPPPPPSEAAPPATVAQPAPAATKPAPAPAPPPLPAGTMSLHDAMEQVSDADLEGSLERWAEGKDIDLAHVIKRTGVFVKVAPKIKWEEHDKRAKNPADFDRLVRESLAKARELVAAAEAGKSDQIKPLSDQLLQLCVDCHTSYK
jgi:hypothetical protein